MLFLRILDAINAIAEDFAESPSFDLAVFKLKASKFSKDELPSLSRSIVNCLPEAILNELGEYSFVLNWDCFIVTVEFIERIGKPSYFEVSADLCDEVPFDF